MYGNECSNVLDRERALALNFQDSEKPSGSSHYDICPWETNVDLEPLFGDRQDNLAPLDHNFENDFEKLLSNNRRLQRLLEQRKLFVQESIAKVHELQHLKNDSRSHNDFEVPHYFRDPEGKVPELNPDSYIKMEKEIEEPLILRSTKWRFEEDKILSKSIRIQNYKLMMDLAIQDLEGLDKKGDKHILQELKGIMNEISTMDQKNFEFNIFGLDWNEISSHLPKRTPHDCLIRWTVHLHPAINHSEWTKEEETTLLSLAGKHKFRHWAKIAEELGTNRTSSACFIHFQRKLNKTLLKGKWSEAEDDLMKKGIEMFGEGNWQEISSLIPGRMGQQCLHRWLKCIRPDIKRGRWTELETQWLLAAVDMFSTKNWFQIQQYVPGKTDVQCRERYVNILDNSLVHSPWTPEEDKALLAAAEKYGPGKWSLIAKELGNRTDNMNQNQKKKGAGKKSETDDENLTESEDENGDENKNADKNDKEDENMNADKMEVKNESQIEDNNQNQNDK
ncbi:hypothetical protein ROZALSC1DRAFT_27161 [Rozella allomycis CSF55]|uniref:Homeo-like domain-containing protein n=1 Tax=Rozella allomycis (strain CSF55) TaxID=988480 RepID=A0A075AVB4_ROZAC|nr:Homeo-like domain-containing protein [Rozella allomycis CSF55]RKP21425.1 hypothetical protein ROZALSC1DRAFT_27161 [Rozella allomycis CSF55]|eukprot:EPZ32632.1 Homeo-like domain-containing protein [Rozella allomycis CSF55]